MADAAAAKREARRRKILENSEYRLRRITGQASHREPSSVEESKKSVETETPSNAPSSTVNGVLASEAIVESQSVDSLIDELNADIDVEESTAQSRYAVENDIFTLLSTPNVPHRRNAVRTGASGENGDTSNRARFSPERRDSLGDLLLDTADREDQNASAKPDPSLINSILSSRLIYVALAIVVNIMVILKLEHLFGMTIIVPFFVIMIGRLCVCANEEASQGSNMLVAALILSNVRPDLVKVINRLKGSFSTSGKILQDFAVYMFTFVLVHTALHRYFWNDLEHAAVFPEQAKEMFDGNV